MDSRFQNAGDKLPDDSFCHNIFVLKAKSFSGLLRVSSIGHSNAAEMSKPAIRTSSKATVQY